MNGRTKRDQKGLLKLSFKPQPEKTYESVKNCSQNLIINIIT